jgi:hypothetical protein
MRAAHHELCFGCGLANVFGLSLEAQLDDQGVVRGRFFVKQDHQGADGSAHPGILAAALLEGIQLAQVDGPSPALRVALDVRGTAAVGSFLDLEATAERATLRGEHGDVVASARTG